MESEYYFLLLYFVIELATQCKSNFFYLIPLQLITEQHEVVYDLKLFPEILIATRADDQEKIILVGTFLADFIIHGEQSERFHKFEIDDDLIFRLKYCYRRYQVMMHYKNGDKKLILNM